jgi:hypothetical protein
MVSGGGGALHVGYICWDITDVEKDDTTERDLQPGENIATRKQVLLRGAILREIRLNTKAGQFLPN